MRRIFTIEHEHTGPTSVLWGEDAGKCMCSRGCFTGATPSKNRHPCSAKP